MRPNTVVVIPAYGRPDLIAALLGDLQTQVDGCEVIIMDNRGDLELDHEWLTVWRPVENLRWIGTVNWGLNRAIERDAEVAVFLNTDVRLSNRVISSLRAAVRDADDIALVAPCYDDYWEHQRATMIPATAAVYKSKRIMKDVKFCDGTAFAVSLSAVKRIGFLDQWAFTWQGYGADIDFGYRARQRGYRVVVTEEAYVSHMRRGSLLPQGGRDPRTRIEIERGMRSKYGRQWRDLVGLNPSALAVDLPSDDQ